MAESPESRVRSMVESYTEDPEVPNGVIKHHYDIDALFQLVVLVLVLDAIATVSL